MPDMIVELRLSHDRGRSVDDAYARVTAEEAAIVVRGPMIAPDTLIEAYASGWFPMAVAPGEIRWYSPDPRGIIPLETFHVPRRLARALRGGRFEIRVDTAFRDVIAGCAERVDAEGNWID